LGEDQYELINVLWTIPRNGSGCFGFAVDFVNGRDARAIPITDIVLANAETATAYRLRSSPGPYSALHRPASSTVIQRIDIRPVGRHPLRVSNLRNRVIKLNSRLFSAIIRN